MSHPQTRRWSPEPHTPQPSPMQHAATTRRSRRAVMSLAVLVCVAAFVGMAQGLTVAGVLAWIGGAL